MKFLITGGAGFIGCNYVKYLLKNQNKVIVLDNLTYAGNLENLRGYLREDSIIIPSIQTKLSKIRILENGKINFDKDITKLNFDKLNSNNYSKTNINKIDKMILNIFNNRDLIFVYGNIIDNRLVNKILPLCDYAVNFAAETHVDRSILNPDKFIKTDIYGTYSLLESVKKSKNLKKFVHVSTDEIYGIAYNKSFTEKDPINPRNPYSASKAAADRLVYAYHKTYNLPVNIVRPSNNYGPFQYPEKLIPVMIIKAYNNEILPVYGNGKQIRDWLYVEDTVKAIDLVIKKAKIGEIYNIAGRNEKQNIEIIKYILNYLNKPEDLIKFTKDRPGHDIRYSIDDSKIRTELGFNQNKKLNESLNYTIKWYINNVKWWRKIIDKDKEYKKFTEQWYASRK